MDNRRMKCGFCGHCCNRTYSDYPPSDTPKKKVTFAIDAKRGAMYCSSCSKFTIYAGSQEEGELTIKQYKPDQPS